MTVPFEDSSKSLKYGKTKLYFFLHELFATLAILTIIYFLMLVPFFKSMGKSLTFRMTPDSPFIQHKGVDINISAKIREKNSKFETRNFVLNADTKRENFILMYIKQKIVVYRLYMYVL